MFDYIKEFVIIVFVYTVPLVLFFQYSRKKGIELFVPILVAILYIPSIFIFENVYPFLVALIVIALLKILQENDYYRFNFSLRSVKPAAALKYAFIFYALNIIVSIISVTVLSIFFKSLNDQEVVTRLQNNDLIYTLMTFPVAVIFAPVLEEFVFRWFYFEKIMKGRIGVYSAAVISSLMFGMMHFNLKAFLPITILGLFNCYLIEKKGYWYCVINHSIFNLITFVMLFIDKAYIRL